MSTTRTSAIKLNDLEEEEPFTLSIENGQLYLNQHDTDYLLLGAIKQLKHTSHADRVGLTLTFANCAASLPFAVHADEFASLKKWLSSDQSELFFNMNLIKGEPSFSQDGL